MYIYFHSVFFWSLQTGVNAEMKKMVNLNDGGMSVEAALQNRDTLMDFDTAYSLAWKFSMKSQLQDFITTKML